MVSISGDYRKKIDEDPELSAYHKWVSDAKWSEEWHNPKMYLNAVTSGLASSAQVALVAAPTALLTRNPAAAVRAGQAVMYSLEGSSSLEGGMDYLTKDFEVSKEEATNDYLNFKAELRKNGVEDNDVQNGIPIKESYKKLDPGQVTPIEIERRAQQYFKEKNMKIEDAYYHAYHDWVK